MITIMVSITWPTLTILIIWSKEQNGKINLLIILLQSKNEFMLVVKIIRSLIMLLNIGIILSIGIVFHLLRVNHLRKLENWLRVNGEVLLSSWKISQLKLLVILDLDGLGLLKKMEKLQFLILLMLAILWPMGILLYWLLMFGNMPTILITEMLGQLIFKISLILWIGISWIKIGLMRRLIYSSEWSYRIIIIYFLCN